VSSTYTTVQGDTWDIIAKKTMGNERYMSLLLNANPKNQLMVIFPAGIVLDIPPAPPTSPQNLPPWKRGGAG
jgi:phage tail protein X